MLYWSWLLHFYQPPSQFPEITKKISQESYEKILKILDENKQARLTINFPASLGQQLARAGLPGVIKGFAQLIGEGRIELVGSAAYHPLLPRIPQSEIERQIRLNKKINRNYFGPAWRPQGFFPPEMAYSSTVGEIVEKLGYQWIILDEGAMEAELAHLPKQIYKKRDSNLAVFIRNRQLSLAIAFAQVTSIAQLLKFFEAERYILNEDRYVVVALDGETFGHHQPRQLRFLSEILALPIANCQLPIKFVTLSQLLELFPQRQEIEPRTSTWGESWQRWDDPQNPIHRLQWKLYHLALKVGRGALEKGDAHLRARLLLDKALHSDQFWWASHSPCWHPKMVERGASMLREVVLLSSVAKEQDKNEAQKLYNKIILTGRKLYGEEIIPC